jgi:excisionase family DNA binding protein
VVARRVEMSDCAQLLFSKKEAAAMLGLSVRSVDYLLAGRQLEYRKIGRKVLIPKAAIVGFAKQDHEIVRSISDLENTTRG